MLLTNETLRALQKVDKQLKPERDAKLKYNLEVVALVGKDDQLLTIEEETTLLNS